MRALAIPIAAAVLTLGACSKPAEKTETAAADAGDAASNAATTGAAMAGDATAGATDPGGAVSPPSGNGAVNADANRSQTDTAAAANSFTEGQAKGHIENAGYTDVSDLQKTSDGLWTAKAKKDGKAVQVSVDFKGAVSAK